MSTSTILTWEEICARYPDEWVVLVDVVYADNGWIGAARVATHHPCPLSAHENAPVFSETCDPVLTHTAGRSLLRPRIELLDEDDDVLRPRP